MGLHHRLALIVAPVVLVSALPAAGAEFHCETWSARETACWAAVSENLRTQFEQEYEEEPCEMAPPCTTLASDVYQAYGAAAAPIPMRAVLPAPADTRGAQGSPAQSAAVASPRPVSDTGGTVSFSGTPLGPRLIAALAFNPATLVADTLEELSEASRAIDVSLVLPADPSGENGARIADAFDFVGLRVRLNLVPFVTASAFAEIEEAARVRSSMRWQSWKDVETALNNAADVGVCAGALRRGDEEAMDQWCGGPPPRSAVLAEDAFWDAVQRYRRTMDSLAAGLDLRADVGDPGFIGKESAEGLYVTAAASLSWLAVSWLDLRGRLGATYVEPFNRSDLSDRDVALDYGGGVELALGPIEQAIRLSVGLEGRESCANKCGDLTDDFLRFQLGVTVPISDGNAVSVGLSRSCPEGDCRGHGETILNIGGDWLVQDIQLGD